jgi:hypothetical protein
LDLSTVEAQNLGLLLPQVPLTGTTDETTIPHPDSEHLPAGLMVYATGTGGLTSGVYVWDGGKWNTIAPAAGTVGDGSTTVMGADGHKYMFTASTYTNSLTYTCPSGYSRATIAQVYHYLSAWDCYAIIGLNYFRADGGTTYQRMNLLVGGAGNNEYRAWDVFIVTTDQRAYRGVCREN